MNFKFFGENENKLDILVVLVLVVEYWEFFGMDCDFEFVIEIVFRYK